MPMKTRITSSSYRYILNLLVGWGGQCAGYPVLRGKHAVQKHMRYHDELASF